MGWSVGYDSNWERDIGYGVPAYCDHPQCWVEIDRGLSYVCGADPYGGDKGCGLYFCSHHQPGDHQRCPRCASYKKPYKITKPEHPDWIHHKLTDDSWQQWRNENPQATKELKEHGRNNI